MNNLLLINRLQGGGKTHTHTQCKSCYCKLCRANLSAAEDKSEFHKYVGSSVEEREESQLVDCRERGEVQILLL